MANGDAPRAILCLTAIRNEAGLAGAFLGEFHKILRASGHLGRARLVVVDDASTDSTPEALALEAARLEGLSLEVLRLPANRGNQSAMAWGLRKLGPRLEGSHLITFDADGEDDLAALPRLAAMLDEDPRRMVFVTRDGRSDGLTIRIFYRVYRLVYRALTGQRVIPCNMSAGPGDPAP